MLKLLCFLCSFTYGNALRDLDDPRYAVRAAAQKKLGLWAYPAVYQRLLTTDSVEVRDRCERLLEATDRERKRLWFWCTTRASAADWEATATALVNEPYERDGLPWCPIWATQLLWEHPKLASALGRIARRHGVLSEDETLCCEGVREDSGMYAYPTHFHDLDDVRFLLRRLPCPSYYDYTDLVSRAKGILEWQRVKLFADPVTIQLPYPEQP